eukprot:SAG31_NODE_820_length_11808_cov_16.331540_15_plen_133_part_00
MEFFAGRDADNDAALALLLQAGADPNLLLVDDGMGIEENTEKTALDMIPGWARPSPNTKDSKKDTERAQCWQMLQAAMGTQAQVDPIKDGAHQQSDGSTSTTTTESDKQHRQNVRELAREKLRQTVRAKFEL